MNERPCVRCGVNPRQDELFVCPECRADPRFRGEVRAAEEAAIAHAAQRVWLMENAGWAGGWSLRRGSVRGP